MPRALLLLVALFVVLSMQCMAKCEIVPAAVSCHETQAKYSVDQDVIVDAGIPAPTFVAAPVTPPVARISVRPRAVLSPAPPLRV
jgi:hypothetical protein